MPGPLHDPSYFSSRPVPTPEAPLRILFSACLLGTACGYEGPGYPDYPPVLRLAGLPNVRAVRFCPEDYSYGTPRALSDIYGGNGFDVLDGRARVRTTTGDDWTDGMLAGARQMLAVAQANAVDLAVMMDVSAACGSQVIYDGSRMAQEKRYQIGPGVSAALLLRHGFPVVAQRDHRTLERLLAWLEGREAVAGDKLDHHETAWYRAYFE